MQQMKLFFGSMWARYRAARRGMQVGIAIGALVLSCALCGIWGSTLPSANTTNGANIAAVATVTTLGHVTGKATATTKPKSSPTPTVTAKPTATHAVPIATSVVPPTATTRPQPTATPRPRPTATPLPYPAIDGNPWDYTLVDTGNILYNPNGAICNYLPCIPSFWQHTNGYVDECADGDFSHSGGVQGACSHHGGESQPVYQP